MDKNREEMEAFAKSTSYLAYRIDNLQGYIEYYISRYSELIDDYMLRVLKNLLGALAQAKADIKLKASKLSKFITEQNEQR